MKHTWDAGGNLTQRQDVLAAETETFTYDFLDRLTSVSGPYGESYAYNEIGNIMSKNGVSYNYGTKPHAVTSVGSTSYVYDNNGNMMTRGSQTLTWDVENRPVSVTSGNVTSTFIYDGDGNRVKKTEGGQIILYVNAFYEKNMTTGNVTTYYYLGGMLVAMRQGTTLTYVHQDHLTGTAVVSDSSGALVSSIKYFPFGECRNSQGNPGTDRLFTGQRLDGTGLYYYGARYYDASIGRFISADAIVQSPGNPQTLNRYSYCLNNPLAYIDPTGHEVVFDDPTLQVLLDPTSLIAQSPGMYGMIYGWAMLRYSWWMFWKAVPELASWLETVKIRILIRWDSTMEDGLLGESLKPGLAWNLSTSWIIRLNPNAQSVADRTMWGNEWKTLITLAEEAFHVGFHLGDIGRAMGVADSKDEEVVAKSFSWWVGLEFGYVSAAKTPFSAVVPFLDEKTFSAYIDLRVTRLAGCYEGYPRLDSRQLTLLYAFAAPYWPSWPIGATQPGR